MEFIFRQRLDRPDKQGRVIIFGDLHWAGGHRWKIPTGVKVLPKYWQPTKERRIYTGVENSNALNLRLTRLANAVQGVFTAAEGAGRAEADVSQAELQVAIDIVAAGSQRRAKVFKPTPVPDPTKPSSGPVPLITTWAEFETRWRAENEQLSESYLRAAKQVVAGLVGFDASLRLATLTKERLASVCGLAFRSRQT